MEGKKKNLKMYDAGRRVWKKEEGDVDGVGDGAQGLLPFMQPPIASVPVVLHARSADRVEDRKDLDMVLPRHAIGAAKRGADGESGARERGEVDGEERTEALRRFSVTVATATAGFRV